MFFPQLVAGPIERTANLMGQLKEKHYLKAENVSFGGRMMLYGMFKKIVVADSLAIVADRVFNNVDKFGGWGLVFGVLCFTIQIYCDFSGYSDIAIGCAKIMDINLMKNFDTPYFSASVPEFWRRWHISLSTWFKDYVYIPLGGNRVSKPRWIFNQLFTFTVSGVWHGAGYTYVVWGFLNGVYIVVSRFIKPIKEKTAKLLRVENKAFVTKPFSILVTFTLISFSWIFFRSNTFSDAFYIIKNMFGPSFVDFGSISAFRMGVCIGAVILLMTIEGIMSYGKRIVSGFNSMPHFIRVVCYGIMVAIILIFGSFGENQFIYFQF
jgi:D-alanyl-lipoteichoic acid acyltransferase DltB (MBOAT superfamily)